MKLSRLGIDLAKNVFELCGVNEQEQVVYRKRVSRAKLMLELSRLEPCLVGMEACGSAHYWARRLQALGFEVKLMAPQWVRPYRRGNKTDRNDAEAIVEALGRPTMRFVSVKSEESQAILSLHRVRDRVVKERTALINQLRGLLAEFGVVVAQGGHRMRQALPEILEDGENGLPALMRELLWEQYERLKDCDAAVQHHDRRIERLARESETAQRLMQVSGIGAITATAVIASVGNAKEFKRSREFAAWLGLVPREHSSGGKQRLGRITKQGNRYLRTLLVHGARSVVNRAGKNTDGKSQWALAVKGRRGHNKALVALAAKQARIVWALLTSGSSYQAELAAS